MPERWFYAPVGVAPPSQSSTEPAREPAPEPALPAVDRAAVVKELSGLIQEPRARHEPPPAPAEGSGRDETGSENGRDRFARFVRRSGD